MNRPPIDDGAHRRHALGGVCESGVDRPKRDGAARGPLWPFSALFHQRPRPAPSVRPARRVHVQPTVTRGQCGPRLGRLRPGQPMNRPPIDDGAHRRHALGGVCESGVDRPKRDGAARGPLWPFSALFHQRPRPAPSVRPARRVHVQPTVTRGQCGPRFGRLRPGQPMNRPPIDDSAHRRHALGGVCESGVDRPKRDGAARGPLWPFSALFHQRPRPAPSVRPARRVHVQPTVTRGQCGPRFGRLRPGQPMNRPPIDDGAHRRHALGGVCESGVDRPKRDGAARGPLWPFSALFHQRPRPAPSVRPARRVHVQPTVTRVSVDHA
jgi:hypothetical protein